MQALETFKIGANPIEALTSWCFSSLTNLKELDIKNLTSLGKKDNPSIEVSIHITYLPLLSIWLQLASELLEQGIKGRYRSGESLVFKSLFSSSDRSRILEHAKKSI